VDESLGVAGAFEKREDRGEDAHWGRIQNNLGRTAKNGWQGGVNGIAPGFKSPRTGGSL